MATKVEQLAAQIQELESKLKAGRQELGVLKERYQEEFTAPNMRKLIGQWYKYRNSYSCTQSWWMYSKVIGIRDSCYRLLSFAIDSYGKLEISEGTSMDLENYLPITKDEALAAVLPMLEMVEKEVRF